MKSLLIIIIGAFVMVAIREALGIEIEGSLAARIIYKAALMVWGILIWEGR